MKITVEPPLTIAAGPDVLDTLPGKLRDVADRRLRLVVSSLSGAECTLEGRDLAEAVAECVGDDSSRLWLVRSVLGAYLPSDDEMTDAMVRFRLADLWSALMPAFERLASQAKQTHDREVKIVAGGITCDVSVTCQTMRLSGIHRVVRETVARWRADQDDLIFVAWEEGYTGLRMLTEREHSRLFRQPGWQLEEDDGHSPAPLTPVVVPWQGLHLVPELYTQPNRVERMLALTHYSGLRVADVGYDCIPITSAATTKAGIVAGFARGLAARRHNDRIATISGAAAEEFKGWVGMGAGRLGRGPEITAIELPTEARQPSDHDMEEARFLVKLGDRPVVLVVGSHEPRKNHLGVLHAAEVLWQDGIDFTLTLVGGVAWHSEPYEAEVERLLEIGRPIQSIRALSDPLLWAAYRIAHCTVFPSFNEGFGLPVAESLAAGTPVITSDFGSMRDIVMAGHQPLGGLLVNPRHDRSIVDALRTLLTDEVAYARLKEEITRRPLRTWDEYAAELWDYLVHG